MRMRQSLSQFEAAFHEEAAESRVRREELRHDAAKRSRARRAERVEKAGTLRYAALVAALIATTVIVTIVMFQALAFLVG